MVSCEFYFRMSSSGRANHVYHIIMFHYQYSTVYAHVSVFQTIITAACFIWFVNNVSWDQRVSKYENDLFSSCGFQNNSAQKPHFFRTLRFCLLLRR